MITLASPKECCGCAACIDACSRQAIWLKEDLNGYYFPIIETEKCVECGACRQSCHILQSHKVVKNDCKQSLPYAAWSLNPEIIEKSASGGIFAQTAYNFLSQPHSYVYGASLQNDSSVRHIEINNIDELYKLQNSKYQQSVCTGIYAQVKKRLKEGAKVFFSGTPCEIAALYVYLKYNSVLLQKLFTAEVICHGVPSNKIHRLGLRYAGAQSIQSYRTKSKGWLNGNRLVYNYADGRCEECATRTKDFIFRTYLSFSFSRKSCYICKYSTLNRVADLTLGDFWGFDKSKYNNYKGISLVLVNSEKGKELFVNGKDIHHEVIAWEECLPYNQNLYMPTNKQIFIGSDYVHGIMSLPSFISKAILQNGFSNRWIDRLYSKAFTLLTLSVKRKKQQEMDNLCREAIKKLKE